MVHDAVFGLVPLRMSASITILGWTWCQATNSGVSTTCSPIRVDLSQRLLFASAPLSSIELCLGRLQFGAPAGVLLKGFDLSSSDR
jgi:hypothetical protein